MRPQEMWAKPAVSAAPTPPVRSSPRLNRVRTDPPSAAPDSPRKRARKQAPPPSPRRQPPPSPSPRRSTRVSAAHAQNGRADSPTPIGDVAPLSFQFPFALDEPPMHPSTDGADLESLFLSFDDDANGPPSEAVDLVELFGTGRESDTIMDLLRVIESEGDMV